MFNFEEAKKILQQLDEEHPTGLTRPSPKDLEEALSGLIDKSTLESTTVLGIDIYRYGKAPKLKQSLIPFVFDMIYNDTIANCIELETFFFQKYANESKFRDDFINTGDGGFQILRNPIEAIIFCAYFQMNLTVYNTCCYFPKLRSIVGELTLRYAITHDSLTKYTNNWYGMGIINCSRILSLDRLNRCLVDENTIKWFNENLNGIDSLTIMDLPAFLECRYFSDYDKTKMKTKNLIFDTHAVRSVQSAKIGDIQSKDRPLSIYNLFYQIGLRLKVEPPLSSYTGFVAAVGNMNCSNI